MEPVQYLQALRRRWLVIVASVLVAVAIALLIPSSGRAHASSASGYQATTIVVDPSTFSSGFNPKTSPLASLVTFPSVASRVAKAVGYTGNPLDLTRGVSAEFNSDTGLLSITAEAPTPARAELLANTFASQTIQFLQGLETKTAQIQAAGLRAAIVPLRQQLNALNGRGGSSHSSEAAGLENQIAHIQSQIQQLLLPGAPRYVIAQPAIAQPLAPTTATGKLSFLSSRTGRVASAVIVGLLAGIALALVLERFDTRIRSKESAERHFHAPVLAEIPMSRSGGKGVVSATRPHSKSADAFRLLRTGLLSGATNAGRNGNGNGSGNGDGAGGGREWPKAILVTSPSSAEGKTTVVANLAASFSELGKRVLVLSCDPRRPAVHRLFDAQNVPGLFDVLALGSGPPVLNGLVADTPIDGIRLVPSGQTPERPGELLGSDDMRTALAEARAMADVVLLDTAPVLAGSDPAPLIPEADAVLVVARAGRTTVDGAEWSTEVLTRLRAPVIGVVLNGVDEGSLSGGGRHRD
ncbi:MAG TPA: AAA family ATPase [Actinomycetota bacterium]|nr:AAA family ATPase [Actinomycetota bacterium]